MFVVILNCFVFHSPSNAVTPVAQQTAPAAKTLKAPLFTPVKKVLQMPLLVNEASIPPASLYSSLIAAIDRVHKAYSPIRFTDCPSGWFSLEETYYGGYKAYVKNCANKSYSVQDQATAGCQGNDTVDQCTDKLLRYCLSRYEQSKSDYNNPSIGDLKSRITKGIEKSDKIRHEAEELSDALKNLKNLMP